jgi:hypothetical protein
MGAGRREYQTVVVSRQRWRHVVSLREAGIDAAQGTMGWRLFATEKKDGVRRSLVRRTRHR